MATNLVARAARFIKGVRGKVWGGGNWGVYHCEPILDGVMDQLDLMFNIVYLSFVVDV